jgi:hypothetical protein
LKGINDLGDLGMDGKVILSSILMKQGGAMWTGLNWLKIGTSGGVL